ncbi:hypothetical protein C8250_021735 [Streptomyces sp. So13.3]|uniref:hypothetical protein n=1 Tax=Streptomyces sp. So13.3 TaxID=2136173 RepID=UPI0011067D94|nr:hypothetical protein [Streptomyces sp. So13.3]QNA74180.1 hypothetical protein C8250_021735 [Streptomyces sp. So13.3]
MITDPQTGEGFDAPTPAVAYANAPSITSEISAVLAMVSKRSAERRTGLSAAPVDDREFWLRKAALLDRIALEDHRADTITAAVEATAPLVALDREHPGLVVGPHHPDSIEWDPSHRPYVRQEYAAWRQHD